jgi:hypothetical protein
MEGILALALAQKNHTPFILTRRACKRAQQYFRVFGITNFIYFDDAMDQSADENDNVILDELLCSNLSLVPMRFLPCCAEFVAEVSILMIHTLYPC